MPFLYTGQRYVPETGLYYSKNRVYDPTIGRFLSRDAIGYSQGPSLYEYADSNPVAMIDPLGLKPQSPYDVGMERFIRETVAGHNAMVAHLQHIGDDSQPWRAERRLLKALKALNTMIEMQWVITGTVEESAVSADDVESAKKAVAAALKWLADNMTPALREEVLRVHGIDLQKAIERGSIPEIIVVEGEIKSETGNPAARYYKGKIEIEQDEMTSVETTAAILLHELGHWAKEAGNQLDYRDEYIAQTSEAMKERFGEKKAAELWTIANHGPAGWVEVYLQFGTFDVQFPPHP